MKNFPQAEKSSDEIAQIQAALFQLAARIENDRPPTPVQPPFTDLTTPENKLDAVPQEIEKSKPDFSTVKQNVTSSFRSANVSADKKENCNRAKSSSSHLIKAEFHIEAPAACSVKLAADFTDWEKHPLTLIKSEDGVWFTLVPLQPGRYAYRFIIDGQWCDDPHSFRSAPNPFGTANAVVVVT